MTTDQLDTAIADWSTVFKAELEKHLRDLCPDKAYGFAIELPSDFSNDGIISLIAKTQSALAKLDDWEYVPNGKTFDETCDKITELYGKYHEPLEDESFYIDFGNRLYARILTVVHDAVASGEYPGITLWLLTLSDDVHPILTEAATLLNAPSQHELAKSLIN